MYDVLIKHSEKVWISFSTGVKIDIKSIVQPKGSTLVKRDSNGEISKPGSAKRGSSRMSGRSKANPKAMMG
jgi:hypothetical protein